MRTLCALSFISALLGNDCLTVVGQALPGGPLQISSRENHSIVINWPDSLESDLQSSSTLGAGAVWSSVSERVQDANGQWTVTTDSGATSRFFRLAQATGAQLSFHLDITGQLTISWPSTSQQYVLQVADRLDPNAWHASSAQPTSINGRFSLTVQVGAQMQFFRLTQSVGPQLEFHLDNTGQLTVSWPNTSQPFVLEVADRLAPADWHAPSAQPTSINGRFSLTFPDNSQAEFFRLRAISPSATLTAGLAMDTGVSQTDGLTSIFALKGQVVGGGGEAVNLAVAFDDAASSNFTEITNQVASDGSFFLDETLLSQLNGGAVADGPHAVHLQARSTSGAVLASADVSFVLATSGPTVSFNPSNGAQDVLPTQIVLATFSEPVVIPGSGSTIGLSSTNLPLVLRVSSTAGDVPGRLILDQTHTRLSFVPMPALPGSTELHISLDLSLVMDLAGNPAQAPVSDIVFRTANSDSIPGTSLAGWVFDAARGTNGNEIPLVGAAITLANNPTVQAVTDANGRFELDNLPAGKVLIEVDGRTVKTASGTFYPSVTKLFQTIVGTASMIDVPIYLPLLAQAALVNLSTNGTTMVSNAAQLPGWTLEVPPNAVQRRDGSIAGQLLIAPVPPDRLPAPLPAGVNPSAVITVQAPGGADVFTTPVPLTAPNLEGLPPGAKTVLWDFDHARGQFVPVATATVSADGKTVTTDPGQGVVRPGWHFVLRLVTGHLSATDTPNKKTDGRDLTPDQRDQLAKLYNDLILSLEKASLEAGSTASPLGGLPGLLTGLGLDTAEDLIGKVREQTGTGDPENAVEALAKALGTSSELAHYWSEQGAEALEVGRSLAMDTYRQALAGDQAALNILNATPNTLTRINNNINALGDASKWANRLNKANSALEALLDFLRALDDAEKINKILEDPPGDATSLMLANIQAQAAVLRENLGTVLDGLGRSTEAIARTLQIAGLQQSLPHDAAQLTSDQRTNLLGLADAYDQQYRQVQALDADFIPSLSRALGAGQKLGDVATPPPAGRVFYAITLPSGAVLQGSTVGEETFNFDVNPDGETVKVQAGTLDGFYGEAVIAVPNLTVGSLGNVDFFPPKLILTPNTAPDTNGNGIPDNVEALISATPLDRATAADLLAGIDPSSAGVLSDGVIGRLQMLVPVNDVAAGRGFVFVATGQSRVEVVDISRPLSPVAAQTLTTTLPSSRVTLAGDSLAVTETGQLTEVFDVTDPRAPVKLFAVNADPSNLGRAVLGKGFLVLQNAGNLESYDLTTGARVSQLPLAGTGVVHDLLLTGGQVFTLIVNDPGASVSLMSAGLDDSGKLEPLGALTIPNLKVQGQASLSGGDGMLFIADVAAPANLASPGFAAVDVSNPGAPALRGGPSASPVTFLAPDGSGRALAALNSSPQPAIGVFDVSDPSNTGKLITTIPIAVAAQSIVLAGGFGIAGLDGGGLSILRFGPSELGNVPPKISFTTPADGTTIVEGQITSIHVAATDDVRVARVELLAQGDRLVTTDVNFPFDLDFLPPTGLPDGTALLLTVRAIDVGGNVSTQTVHLVYHAVPPRVFAMSPAPGSTTHDAISSLTLDFSEPLDSTTVAPSDLLLVSAGPDGVFDTSDDVTIPMLIFAPDAPGRHYTARFGQRLLPGQYRLTLPSAQVKEPGGLSLDGEFTGSFPSGDGKPGGDFVAYFQVQVRPQWVVNAIPFRGIRTDTRDYSGFNTFSSSSPVALADVNGDGQLDVLRGVFSARRDTNQYHVLNVALQDKDGTFLDPLTYSVPDHPIQVLAGDVNGDGKVDVVTIHFDPSFSFGNSQAQPFGISVLLGNGNGTLQPAQSINTGGRLLFSQGVFLLGDFTGDGRADLAQLIPDLIQTDASHLVVTNRAPAEVLIYPGLSSGTFGSPLVTTLSGPTNLEFSAFSTMAAADLNGDGKVDLVIPSFASQASGYVLLSNGDGTFTANREPLLENQSSTPVLADFTGDGKIDLISGNRFLRGLGDGRFQLVQNEGLKSNGVGSSGLDIGFVADFDRDGRPDYATYVSSSDFLTDTLGVFTNKADGTFALMTKVVLSSELFQAGLVAADLNGDSFPDLLFEVGDGNDLPFYACVLYGVPGGFPTVPSIGNTEQVGTLDSSMPFLADLNGDGIPDLIGPLMDPNPEPVVAVLPSQSGSFGPLLTNAIGTTNPNFYIRALGAGDFHQNGKVDVIAAEAGADFSSGGAVYLMAGTGDGHLQPGQLLSGVSNVLAVADFTGDGRPDLLSYTLQTGRGPVAAVFPGNANGTFAPPIFSSDPQGSLSGQALIGDFNGDGKPDLFVGGFGISLQVWLNDGTGHFRLASSTNGAPVGWEALGVGDFNRDGELDVLMREQTGDLTFNLRVVPGDGTGKLGAPLPATPFPGSYQSKAIVIDINQDGTPDLVTRGQFGGSFEEARVSLGNGDGTFQPPISFFGVFGGNFIAAADFTGDGLIDLFVGENLLIQRKSGQH
jgi:tetratricopeptide (TPR) repeat protein